MEGHTWDDSGVHESIGFANQLLIKRSKIDVKIILKESSPQSKYELFQRLNAGGSVLAPQELRNCMLVMANQQFFQWFEDLRKRPAFMQCLALSDRNLEEQYDLDLICRFLVLHNTPDAELEKIGDIGPYLDDKMVDLASSPQHSLDELASVFEETFNLIEQALGDNAFKRYVRDQGRYRGGFLISAFEYIALGVGFNVANGTPPPIEKLERASQEIWSKPEFQVHSGSGVRASSRIPKVVVLGRADLSAK